MRRFGQVFVDLSCNSLRWINPGAAKGLAATNPPGTFGNAFQDTVFLYGADHVIAACRLKTALAAKEGAERQLIQADAADGGEGGKTH
jgi:hypothetical protein